MPDDDEIVLVCMSINAPFISRGSSVDRVCGTCGFHVMIAPSGQKFLRERPKTTIMCTACCAASTEDKEFRGFAADRETLLRECKTSMPNVHRQRN